MWIVLKKGLLAGLLLWGSTPALFAWGATGHRVVGKIAERHLSDEAKREVRRILGAESLARASTWPDEIRSDRRWACAGPWHYISVDDDETFYSTKRAKEGDVIQAIRYFSGQLRSDRADDEAKAVALRFLIHLIGDVHQPLHVGRRNDRGGNFISVKWFNEETNLHALWDFGMIAHSELSFTELADFIDHPTAQQIKAWQHATDVDWLMESFKVRKQVYDIGPGELGYEYAYRHFPLIEDRLLKAGVRAAGLLNAVVAGRAGPANGDVGDTSAMKRCLADD